MLRGTTTFKCTQCGEKFKGLDIEWMATIFSCPQPCPKCGSIRTRPWSLLDLFGLGGNAGYKSIWEQIEKEKKNATTDNLK